MESLKQPSFGLTAVRKYANIAAVVSHGLTNEKRVPPKDIDRAVAAKKRFVENPRRHTHQEE
jgi:hypothetical protein